MEGAAFGQAAGGFEDFERITRQAAAMQMEIAQVNAEVSVQIAEANAIKKAFEKVQG